MDAWGVLGEDWMIWLICGASHTGKTVLARRLVARTGAMCLSLDLLKMGLIRSGMVGVTPTSPWEDITATVWPVAREMICTALENGQPLIVEGCYIPPDWKRDFTAEQVGQMRCVCLAMSTEYILAHREDIARHAEDAEKRGEERIEMERLIAENAFFREKYEDVCPIGDDYERTLDALLARCEEREI